MKNYKLTIQYDGTRYLGWQKLSGQKEQNDRTIQGKLEAVLEKMTAKDVDIQGSGRTDGGVHALGQVASCFLETDKKPEEIQAYLNEYLPEDIAVIKVEEVTDRFHARLSARAKRYRYQIRNSAIPNVMKHKFQMLVKEPLDVDAMKEAAGFLVGRHDYINFSSVKRSKKSTIREIYAISVEKTGEDLTIDFYGNGFLYNMVRILTGTLIEVGKGERSPESVAAIFEAPSREAAGFTAPPRGLILMQVEYQEA